MDARQQLQLRIHRLFSSEFLFDPVRRAWREIVCPTDASGEAPPFIDCAMLLSFADVVAFSGTDAEAPSRVADACRDSDVVEARRAASGNGWEMRRRQPLLEASNPERRTVFARPVHFDATDDDVRAFFSPFGAVERVERRSYADGSAAEKPRPSVFVVFETAEAALACVAAKPTYGSCGSRLADRFVPRLTVVMKSTYAVEAAEAQEADYLRTQRKALAQAVAAADNNNNNGADAGAGGEGESAGDGTRRYLRHGVVCKATDVPANTTWSAVKAKLGNLALHDATLKGGISLVRVEPDKRVAYVVCKTPAVATALVVAYNTQLGQPHGAELRATVPTLTLLEGDEERRVVAAYPSWSGDKAKYKQDKNSERVAHKRERGAA